MVAQDLDFLKNLKIAAFFEPCAGPPLGNFENSIGSSALLGTRLQHINVTVFESKFKVCSIKLSAVGPRSNLKLKFMLLDQISGLPGEHPIRGP